MRKLILLGLCLVFGDLAIASNMGFKLTYTLRNVAGTTGTNWVSVPYFWTPTTAKQVCLDIGANAVLVGRRDAATDSTVTFACTLPIQGFAINPGEAIFVRVNTDNTNWVIVGSHNDTKQLTLRNVVGTTGTNWVSIPYHKTPTTAKQLCQDVGANAVLVGRRNAATDSTVTFSCSLPIQGFTLNVGEGMFIRVNTDSTVYTPSHY